MTEKTYTIESLASFESQRDEDLIERLRVINEDAKAIAAQRRALDGRDPEEVIDEAIELQDQSIVLHINASTIHRVLRERDIL